jgi:hypothetical protein
MSTWVESLGWIATTLFVASYFFVRPFALRVTQIVGALLWIVYGVLIASRPVVVANALVIAAAAWTSIRSWRAERQASFEGPGATR